MKIIQLNMASGHFFYSRSEIRQGEHLASELQITLSPEFTGDYAYNLKFKLNGETVYLTEPLTPVDGIITYPIKSPVTASPGILKLELNASDAVTGLLAKSAVANLKVIESIDGSGEIMPEAYVPWVTVINQAVLDSTTQAGLAEAAAVESARLVGLINNAGGVTLEQVNEATRQAGIAAGHATTATTKAGIAEGYATTATEQAGLAEASAVEAARQVTLINNIGGESLAQLDDCIEQAGIATTQAGLAEGYATTAGEQAGLAAGSAVTASEQAGIAEGHATTAGEQAGIAAGHTVTATTKAGEADASAIAAAGSASTASTKAQEAAGSAGTASTKATDAEQYATTAGQQAGIAAGHATTAGEQAGIAATQAGIADGHATTASQQAGIASGHAATASQQAGIAAGHATTAGQQAAIAEGHALVVTETLSELFTSVSSGKTLVAEAITDKGVTTSASATFSTMATNIGSISGGGAPAPAARKDINFLDYDGTIVASWTLAELAVATALPVNPSHAGLTAQGWNWTLADLKTENQAMNVGQSYITSDGKTKLYITIATLGRMTVPLYWSQTVASGVTIDWGDGSATETFTGTGNKNTTHVYAAVGDYVISLDVTAGVLGLGNGTTTYSVLGESSNANRVYQNMLQKVEVGSGVTSISSYAFQYCYSLESVVIQNSVTSIGSYAFQSCYSLSSVVIPTSVTSIWNYAFQFCYSLESVVIPNSVTSIGSYAFQDCYSLASVVIPNSVTSISSYAFTYCYSLASVVIPDSVTSIETRAFRYCYGIAEYHVLPTTPPTLASTDAFTGILSDCVIYVPLASLAAYQTATNWATYASKMVGE